MRTWIAASLLRLPAGQGTRTWTRALDTVWHAWLETHRPSLWRVLESRGRPASGSDPRLLALSRLALGDEGEELAPDLLATTAARFDHPVGERARARLRALSDSAAVDLFCAAAPESARAVAFCVEERLAPADEVERAVFFVRTKQPEQHRALDPEGALLALGYRSAAFDVRGALREAMAELGDVDVLRVLAGRRSDRDEFAALGESERAYLVERFTAHQDWGRLWPLVPLMPLHEAVETAGRIGAAAWRPSGDDDRRMFEALHGLGPAAVKDWTRAVRGLASSDPVSPCPSDPVSRSSSDPVSASSDPTSASLRIPSVRIVFSDLGERLDTLLDLDFAPDGTRLAVVGDVRDDGRRRGCAGTIDLADRSLSRWDPGYARPLRQVAHLGSDTFVAVLDEAADLRPPQHILCFAPDEIRSLGFQVTPVRALRRIAGDRAFLISAGKPDALHPNSAVLTGDADGSLTDSGILGGIRPFRALATAVGPEGRRFAVVGPDTAVVTDVVTSDVNVLDKGPRALGNGPVHAAMSDSVLVRADAAGSLEIRYDPLGSAQPPVSRHVWPPDTRLTDLVWSPALNRFLAVGTARGSTTLWLLDVPPNPDTPLPDDLLSHEIPLADEGDPDHVRLSPQGDVLAVSSWTPASPVIDLYCLALLDLGEALAGPMGLLNHQDLAHVTAVLRNPALDDESRRTLEVLRTCLEHRFWHDVGIGGTPERPVAGAYEIELGER